MKLYKYIPSKYLDKVLSDGALLFRSLSYFQDFEEQKVRGDQYEGKLKYTGGDKGLRINNETTGKSFDLSASFISSADSENIFIFSLSSEFSKNLAQEFNSEACIEFSNLSQLISKLKSAVKRRKSIKPNRLFHGPVTYYADDEAPIITWAFPDQIAMRKMQMYSHQQEYRFMFSLANALDFEKTTQELKLGPDKTKIRTTPYPEKLIKIGNIRKICEIHKFT